MALIGNSVAPETAAPGAAPQGMPPGPHTMPDGTQMGAAPTGAMQEEAELDDDAFEEGLERVMAAAAQVLKLPDMKNQMAAIVQAPDPAEALSDFALTIIDGLDEKSGETIPEDVLPAAAVGIVGMLAEILEIEPEVVGKATDLLMRKAAMQAGMSPEDIEAQMAAAGGQQGA